jgi:DNA-binding MarR family transcriptional regulator
LYGAVHSITRAYRPLLEPLGLTYPQYVVMMLLWERDEVSLNDVARRARLDPAALTPLLKRLETRGLVARRRSSEDERRLVVTVTEAGRELQEQASGVADAMLCLVGLNAEQEKTLRAMADQIVQALDGQTSPTQTS